MTTNFQAVPDRSIPLRSIPDRGLPQYISGEAPPGEPSGSSSGENGRLHILKYNLHKLKALK